MKKLLLLGGSRYIIPVIKKAKELGIYTITCDYLPDNMAHKYSDEYVNASVIDKELILKIAKDKEIDGIMSFACDPGVVTAAYVAEKMKLPFQCSYESTCILQDKGLFRKFLIDNGFNSPHAKSYSDINESFKDIDYFNWPVIVKPVDSAGSKGVTKVTNKNELKSAINEALNNSHSKQFIIEDFITFNGYHSSTDVFTINGEVKFISYSDQLFDPKASNPYVPSFIIWPSTMDDNSQNYLTKEIQRLMHLLKMKDGVYNIETCVDSDGNPYIMEVSPRGGGCKIAELQELAYGVDLIKREIQKAVSLPVDEFEEYNLNAHWCEMVVHSNPNECGLFDHLEIDNNIKNKNIKVIDMSVKDGDLVKPFTGANMSLGDMFLKFNSRIELDEIISNTNSWLKIVYKNEEVDNEK